MSEVDETIKSNSKNQIEFDKDEDSEMPEKIKNKNRQSGMSSDSSLHT
jgi:hypothetical protein